MPLGVFKCKVNVSFLCINYWYFVKAFLVLKASFGVMMPALLTLLFYDINVCQLWSIMYKPLCT